LSIITQSKTRASCSLICGLLQVDFWTGARRVGNDVRIMLPPGRISDVTGQLRNSGMKVHYRTRNVQESAMLFLLYSLPDIQGGPKKTRPLYIFPNI